MFVINESEKTLIDKLIVYRDDNFFKKMDFDNYLLYVDTPQGLPISHNDENVRIYLLNLKGYRVWYPMKDLYLQAESTSSILGRVSTFNKYGINYEHYEDNELKDFGFTDIDSIVEAGKKLRYDIIVFEKMPNEYIKNSRMNIYVVNKDSKAISNIHEGVRECLKLKKQTNENFEPLLNAESKEEMSDIFVSENIYDVANAIKNQRWEEMKFILDDKANIYILLDPFYLTHFEAFDTVWDSKLYYDTSLNYDAYVSNNFNKSLNFIYVLTTCEGKSSGKIGEDTLTFEYIYDNFNILSRVDISNIPLMKVLGKPNEVLTSKNNLKEEDSLIITNNYLEEKIIKRENKYQVKSEKGIKESILDYEKTKIYYVTSAYEAKHILLNSKETMRVWIDKNKQIYLIGNSYETTHSEMVEEARKEWIDIALDDFDKNQICILYVPQEDTDFDVYGDAIIDDYDTEYTYKNGVRVYSRYNDFSQFKLCNLLGEYTKHRLIKEGYTTPTKLYDITDDTAEFSKEGADWVWWDSEAKHNENYANAYRVKMSPEDFLDLTTRQGSYNLSKGMSLDGVELRDLDIDEFNKETHQPIFLRIEFTNTTSPHTANVIGHEGRHRMFALWKAGVKKVDVQIRVRSNENYDKYNPYKIDRITLTSQFVPSRKVTISGLVPMSWAEHKKIRPDLEQVTEGLQVNQFRLGTAGYILENGSFYEVDEYHGEDSEYRNEGLPEYSNTHPEEDTCVRIYKEPNDEQYQKLEEIIDKYLDYEGYCKVELWNSPLGNYYFYKVYSLYEGACQDDTFAFDEVVGNWTGYKLVQIIKNNIKRNAWDKSIGESLSTKQEDYFKNSKIRDSKGNLIPVYHGSKETDIKVFDPRQAKSQFGEYKFGNAVVNYFSKDRETAKGYTNMGTDEGVYEVYLNIENPYIVNNETASEIKSHSNIKDKKLRNKQLDYFNKVWNKWNNKQISEEDLEKLNNDLFYLGFEVKSSLDREDDNQAYGTDEEWYDLYKLDQNTKFGKKHIVEYSYSLEELFSDDMYDTMKEDIVGIDEKDYYFTTDDIVKMVLLMNEEDNTNYDGIIIPDISDIGPTGSLFSNITTDYVTLKSSNQIKAVSNLNPTNSNRIDEKVEDIKTYPSETKYLSVKDEIIPIGEYLYHATSKENYDNILKDGYIKVGMDSNWGIHSKSDSIYLAIDRDTAVEYANRAELEEIEVLEIPVSSLDLTKLYIDSNEEYYYIDGEGYDVYSFEYKDNINITNNLKEKVIDISNTDI